MVETPELEKLRAISDRSQVIGEFLEWLPTQGIHLANFDEGRDMLWLHTESIQRMLARYFDIDLDRVEQEKLAILEELRSGV